MLTFLARRLAQVVPTLFFVSILIFCLQQLLPGDPALILAGEERDEQALAEIRERYRLDQPLPVQYLYWLGGVLQGDFGESMRIQRPVAELVLEKLPVTLLSHLLMNCKIKSKRKSGSKSLICVQRLLVSRRTTSKLLMMYLAKLLPRWESHEAVIHVLQKCVTLYLQSVPQQSRLQIS